MGNKGVSEVVVLYFWAFEALLFSKDYFESMRADLDPDQAEW